MRVIFIASSGRSGSTVLDRLLGSTTGVWSGGELERVWEVLDEPGRLCACGQPPRTCDFWRAVFREAFGSVDGFSAQGVEALHQKFRRALVLPYLLSPYKTETFRRELREYRDVLCRFYAAIGKAGGVETIVDSSKSIAHAWLLGGVPGIDLSVIHLVRDSRAVAYSWTRAQASTIALPTEQRPVLGAAWGWSAGHTLAETLRVMSRRYLRLRYEDFARDPAAALSTISRRLELPLPSLSEANTSDLADNHIVTGNPMRFQTGEVAIREDDEWKRRVRGRDAALVTALTWPLLLRHGYKLRFR